MSDKAIIVDQLSKSYLIGHQSSNRGYSSLREILINNASNFARKSFDMFRGRPIIQGDQKEEFWALRNVSFELERGEVLGVIGRNGAGKSTLLKVLSRITEPTQGRVTLHGRLASLLEVGTGFHPELTGRENIFLNGAILGMTKIEIQKKFDAIVDFAGVEKFLDTPVKRYSSGMYVRLAFAVAAHLESEILVVDEVLAVGDTEFQRRCLGKMEEVAQVGRTVILVSHNMGSIERLTRTSLVLNNGTVAFAGDTREAIEKYSEGSARSTEVSFESSDDSPRITRLKIDENSLNKGDIIIRLEFKSPFPLCPPVPGIVITSMTGTPVFGSNPRFHQSSYQLKETESGASTVTISNAPLMSGTYRVSAWLGDHHVDYDQQLDALEFEFGITKSSSVQPSAKDIGYLSWPAEWAFESE